jgi:sugar lactone lactonase YvrE
MESCQAMKSSAAGFLMAGAALVLGLMTMSARADILYASNLGSIDKVPSTGIPSTFDTVALNNPQGIAFSLSGNLYVANSGANTIEEFSLGGADLGTFATATSGLDGPVGMAFDRAGNLYVANQTKSTTGTTSTIEKFTPAGVGSVFIPNTAGLGTPSGLAFDSAGNLYVANDLNNTILKFSSTGSPLGTLSNGSTGLSGPDGLAFDAAGNLYVASSNSNAIVKFTSLGVASVFANSGLSTPVGLAFDSAGNLYAANSGNGTVEKFSSSGSPSAFATGFGFGSPEYLAFTNDAGQPLALPIPEPSAGVSLLLAAGGLLARRKRPYRPL